MEGKWLKSGTELRNSLEPYCREKAIGGYVDYYIYTYECAFTLVIHWVRHDYIHEVFECLKEAIKKFTNPIYISYCGNDLEDILFDIREVYEYRESPIYYAGEILILKAIKSCSHDKDVIIETYLEYYRISNIKILYMSYLGESRYIEYVQYKNCIQLDVKSRTITESYGNTRLISHDSRVYDYNYIVKALIKLSQDLPICGVMMKGPNKVLF